MIYDGSLVNANLLRLKIFKFVAAAQHCSSVLLTELQ